MADQLSKLTKRADAVAESASVLVSRAIREIRGELANLSRELNLAGNADDREGVYAMIRRKMNRLGKNLNRLLVAQNQAAAQGAAKAASDMTGLEIKYSAQRAKAICELVTPAQGENLAAVFTDKMGANMISTLREATVAALRQQAVAGGSMKELSRDMTERWFEAMKNEHPVFTDSAGHEWNTATYFQMNVRTNTMRVYNDCLVDNVARETGSDLMRISTGGDPSCAGCFPWEGCIISVSGKTKGFPTYEDARNGGCFHPNCVHTLEYVDEVADADEIALQKSTPVDPDKADDMDAQDERRYEIDQARKMRDEGLMAEQARVAVDRDNLAASIRHGLLRADAADMVAKMTDEQVTRLCPNGNPPEFVPAKGSKRKPEPEVWNHGSRGGVVHIKRDADLAHILTVTKADKAPEPPKTPAPAAKPTPKTPPTKVSAPVATPKPPDDKTPAPAKNAPQAKKGAFATMDIPEFKTGKEGMAFIRDKIGVPCAGLEKMQPEFVRQAAKAIADAKAHLGKDADRLQGVWTFAEYKKQILEFQKQKEAERWAKALNMAKDDPYIIGLAERRAAETVKRWKITQSSQNYGCARYWGYGEMQRFNGIILNNHLDRMDRTAEVKEGFKAQGCEKPFATVYHELGHIIDYQLGLNEHGLGSYGSPVNGVVSKLWRDGDIAAQLSKYGAKNSKEMVAEAWAEYKMNPNPRPVALAIGREIDRLCAERAKQNA